MVDASEISGDGLAADGRRKKKRSSSAKATSHLKVSGGVRRYCRQSHWLTGDKALDAARELLLEPAPEWMTDEDERPGRQVVAPRPADKRCRHCSDQMRKLRHGLCPACETYHRRNGRLPDDTVLMQRKWKPDHPVAGRRKR